MTGRRDESAGCRLVVTTLYYHYYYPITNQQQTNNKLYFKPNSLYLLHETCLVFHNSYLVVILGLV